MDALRPLWDAERPGLHSHAERGNDHVRGLELFERPAAGAGLTRHFLRLVRAIPRPRSDFRVVAASVRALFINSAQATLTIQIEAIVVAHALEGEDFGLLAVTLDDPFLLQALGDVLRRLTALEF